MSGSLFLFAVDREQFTYAPCRLQALGGRVSWTSSYEANERHGTYWNYTLGGLAAVPKRVYPAESGLSSSGLPILARNLFLKNEARETTDKVTGRIA